jgi:hypothetical protein
MLPRGTGFLGIAILGSCGWLAYYSHAQSLAAPTVGQRAPAVRKAMMLSAQELDRIAGDYDLDGEVWTIAPRNGRLFARYRDLPELEILTESANSLFLPQGGGDLMVIEDRRGGVAGLVLRQADRGERIVRRIR